MLFNATAVQYRTSINQHKLILSHSPGGGTTLETPCSPVSFGERFMKIRSAVPENGCLVFFDGRKKTKKNRKKTSVKHIRIRLIGGCVNNLIPMIKTSQRRKVATMSLYSQKAAVPCSTRGVQ